MSAGTWVLIVICAWWGVMAAATVIGAGVPLMREKLRKKRGGKANE